MSFETVIPYVIQHNAVIIQALVALILLLVALLAIRNFMRSGDPGVQVGGASLEQLEATMKKLLEKAGQVGASEIPADAAHLASEIETLRSSLAEKQDQIEQMKMAPKAEGAAASAGPTISAEDKSALESQVRDLQAKLSEYEIISEDIADLSFYKEENMKLQKQLEAQKNAPAGASVSSEPLSSPPNLETARVMSLDEANASLGEPAVAASAPAAAVVEPVVAASPALEDIDPAQAMVDELMNTPIGDLTSAAPEAKPTSMADEDLLKEFADAVSAQGGKPASDEAELAAEALFDVDRMMSEAGALEQLAATAADVPESIEGGLDVDRMVQEAASMEAIKPEDAKLMGDFEDFMKKGGT